MVTSALKTLGAALVTPSRKAGGERFSPVPRSASAQHSHGVSVVPSGAVLASWSDQARMMMANSDIATERRSPLRTAALAVGVVFLLVGIMGFIPGLTTNYSQMSGAGHDSMAKLLGVFQVSVLHNIVHLLFGVAGIAMARSNVTARGYLIGGGLIYLILWVYGLIIDKSTSANFVPLNSADDWLHLILGIGMIGLGVALGRNVGGRRVSAR
jgi:Domain of unknown function (DUF4383)